MMLPLDSLAYRMLWRLKRFMRLGNWGPRPIQWSEPIRQFLPPPSLVESSLDPKEAGNFRMVLRELELLTRLTTKLPSELSENNWRKLIRLPDTKQRFEFLCFLRKKESVRAKDEMVKAKKSTTRCLMSPKEEMMEQRDGNGQKLLWFRKNIDALENEMFSRRCAQAFQMTDELPRIAIDCRWLHLHSERGMNLTFRQLVALLRTNRARPQPWPVSLANFDEKNALLAETRKRHLSILDSDSSFSGDLSPKSYLELFPELRAANKIVYLSPHSKQWLESVDAGTCYVIGGIVDRAAEPGIPQYASLVTAEAEGLPCRRLPLDYRLLKGGSPMFTLDQVLSIVQEVFDHDDIDWQEAVARHISKRKFMASEEKNQKVRHLNQNKADRKAELLRILLEHTSSPPPPPLPPSRLSSSISKVFGFGGPTTTTTPIAQQQLRAFHTLVVGVVGQQQWKGSKSFASSMSTSSPNANVNSTTNDSPDQHQQHSTTTSTTAGEDGSIRRQPVKPSLKKKRLEAKANYWEQYYRSSPNAPEAMFGPAFVVLICLDMVILALIWRVDKKEELDYEEKKQQTNNLVAVALAVNMAYCIYYRVRRKGAPTAGRAPTPGKGA